VENEFLNDIRMNFGATKGSSQLHSKRAADLSSYHEARLNRKSVTGTQRLTPTVLCVAFNIQSSADGFFDDTEDGNCDGRM
jgi:hypothetical protein